VFMEVDTDRDGIISGEQARNLFLSWRLPRGKGSSVWKFSCGFYVFFVYYQVG
jgi:epidermal growth factor receptor substrate 15